jgi:hypothetical protein
MSADKAQKNMDLNFAIEPHYLKTGSVDPKKHFRVIHNDEAAMAVDTRLEVLRVVAAFSAGVCGFSRKCPYARYFS